MTLALHAFQAGNLAVAEEKARAALVSNPRSAEALHMLGVIRGLQNSHAEAEQFLRKAAEFDKKNNFIFFNLAKALSEQNKNAESIPWHKKALVLDPKHAMAWLNYGKSLCELEEIDNAIKAFNQAIEINKNFAEAYTNKANCLGKQKSFEEGLALHDRAIALKPGLAEAWNNRGNALNYLQRHEEALASYERSIELKPDGDDVLGNLVHTQMKVCDWSDLDRRRQTLESRLLTGDQASDPFPILGLFDDPSLQRQCAEIWAKNKFGLTSPRRSVGKRSKKNQIRVAYFSMDFREHPVAHLMAELVECHDRNKFEVHGISFGVNTGDFMRKRMEGAFDKFSDVRHLNELDIARLSRELDIDIAIDLGGYTKDSKPAIFAHRAAPIQINYLGFPGTMGGSQIDYLIADPEVIPTDSQSKYSEKIIYLPNSYQANDSKRLISDRGLTRQEVDLPGSGFVFCCFNNNWKIVPETFDTWIRILQAVPNSVLWLYEDNLPAKRNLSAEASKRGLHADRLVFARRMPHAEHLARYQLADLFLDTFPYGAHTTASDALWAGLPVLTRAGKSFASRVAASLLHATGIPELITYSVEDYESLAVALANNPKRIAGLKARLTANRDTCPLFDTPLFTRHVESAYQEAYDRLQGGLAPDHIYVTTQDL